MRGRGGAASASPAPPSPRTWTPTRYRAGDALAAVPLLPARVDRTPRMRNESPRSAGPWAAQAREEHEREAQAAQGRHRASGVNGRGARRSHDGTVVTGADLRGGDVDDRHVGRGTVGGKAGGGDLDVRPGSAGIAAVQQIALTTWDWATRLMRVGLINALLPAATLAFCHHLASTRSSRPPLSRSATTSRRRAPRGRVHRVPPPRRSPSPSRPLPARSSTAPLSARCGRRRCAANSQRYISACDRSARPVQEAARVATAWDAEVLATARAAWVASAWAAWRDGRAGRTGSGRESCSARRRGGTR